MAALKEWVRGLVLLVVIASFLELLLPMSSMKRFVRMAMGLLIILGVVRPIVGLLGQSVAVNPTLLLSDEPALPSMSQLMTEANRFQARNQKLLLQEAEERLGEEVRGAARKVSGVSDAQAEVRLVTDPGAPEYRVEGVSVMLLLGSNRGEVRPVAPVRVVPGPGGEGTATGPSPEASALSAEEAALAEAVRREVAAHLGLSDAKLVQVQIDRPVQRRR